MDISFTTGGGIVNNPSSGKPHQISSSPALGRVKLATCITCKYISLWIGSVVIYPLNNSIAPVANEDMPEHIKSIYNEASDIVERSPRSAAALLRVCLEELLDYLDKPKGKDLFDRVGKAGFPTTISNHADAVRVFGNFGAHAGEIQLNDQPDILPALFNSINYLVEHNITSNKSASSLLEKMPGPKREAIEKRSSR